MPQIKEEQLKELQKANQAVTILQLELGKIEIHKQGLLFAFNQENDKLNELKAAIEKEFGKGSLNIETGEFEPIAEGQES